jgi:signal transduction histidine kinase
MLELAGARRALIPYLMFAAALSLTASAARYALNAAAVEERLRFENAANTIRAEVVSRVDAYVAMLLGGAGLFAASEAVEPREFRDYVARLQLARRYPGVQGIGFSRLIRDRDRESVLASVRRELPSFHYWPEAPARERHAIVYLEPLDARNALEMGYDMSSEPVRRAAMEKARDTGEPAATGKLTLIQERLDPAGPQAGFLIYVPVYRGGRVPATIEERRERLEGFVYSPFRGDDLLSGMLAPDTPGIAFEVYDRLPGEENLLHRTGAAPGSTALSPLRPFMVEQSIDVAGRPWTLVLRGDRALTSGGRRSLATFVILSGGLLSVLLLAVTRAQIRARAIAERTAEELRRSEEVLRSANAAKDEFLATVSHELRTPLNAIVGWAFMLRRGQVPPEAQAHALDVIARNAAAQTTLIEDLLDVSRAVAGRLQLNPSDVDLVGLLKVAMDSIEPAAREQDLTLIWQVPEDPGSIHADPARLQQIVLNLLSNAVKFTQPGGTITLAAEATADRVTIRVSDNGAGIAPESLPFVFERFWQADTSTTRKYSGVGLGLTISQHLVHLQGGTIEAESAGEGQGTTITVRLPRRP